MRRFLSKEMQNRPPTELVTVRRWQRSAAAEGRWGSLTKCGAMDFITVCHFYDGPFCRFIMKFREVVPVPIFQEFKCLKRRPSTDRCAYDGPSYLLSRIMKEQKNKFQKHGTTESLTVCRDHDDPSRVPSIQPRFERFPANRVLV